MTPASPWWKGPRGEWYVVLQVGLILLVLLGPRNPSAGPRWNPDLARAGTVAGVALLLAGLSLGVAGAISLGKHLTPLPQPKEQASLVRRGAFRLVRHPIYGGGVLASFGWALRCHGWLTLGYAVILALFIDFKARREERWLRDRYPDYAEYQKSVRRLIPFVY